MRTGIDHILGQGLTDPELQEKLKRGVLDLMEKSSSAGRQKALTEREREEAALEEFKGAVVVHSAASTFMRFKLSMAQGKCWSCGTHEPTKTSAYARCAQCEDNDR